MADPLTSLVIEPCESNPYGRWGAGLKSPAYPIPIGLLVLLE